MGHTAVAMGNGGMLIMFNYEKRLEFPINIKQTNAQMATAIITQFGGPNCLLVYTFPTSLKHPYMEILNSIISYTDFFALAQIIFYSCSSAIIFSIVF